MTFYPLYPGELSRGEFAVVRFGLDLLGSGVLNLDHLLGLRRLLQRAGREALGGRAAALFSPPPSTDPVAVRRFQKPAPGFVILAAPERVGTVHDGERIDLEMLLLGSATQSAGDLLAVLRRLGEQGLDGKSLPFEVASAATLEPDGSWRIFWRAPQPLAEPAVGLIRLDFWLEQNWPADGPLVLEFLTPVRLVAGGRLLRRPRFRQLFPFMLRRVTAMLYSYCALEPVDDPAPLLAAADAVESTWCGARWVDWRETGAGEQLGGLTGILQLDGPELPDLLWIVLLASRFGIGKGASYGAGRCRVRRAE